MSCDMHRLIPGPNGSIPKSFPTEYKLEDIQKGFIECECKNWASDGSLPLLNHHHRCEKYKPVLELIDIVKGLIDGIEAWGAEEDGIPADVWETYKRAKVAMGQFDFLKGD